jgi:hypothetical protein
VPPPTIGVDLALESASLLPEREKTPPQDPPGILNDGWIEPVADLAARLSRQRGWLRQDVADALARRAVSLDEIFESAPRFLEIDGSHYRVTLERDGNWEGFDPASDSFFVYVNHEVYDRLGEDRALGYLDGEEWVLFPGDLEKNAAVGLTLAKAAPFDRPAERDRTVELGPSSIALGAPLEVVLHRPAGIAADTSLTKAFCPDRAPIGCSGSTIQCPANYSPYFLITSLRIFDDHEGCCFMGAPEVELYNVRLDTVTGASGSGNVVTGTIFDGRNVVDLAGRTRFLPDVDDDNHQWYNISNGLAVFNANSGTTWGGTLVEDDQDKGKLIIDGASTNIFKVLDTGYQIYQDIRKNENFELIKDSVTFVDMILNLFNNDDDLFLYSQGVTNDFFCQTIRPTGTFPGTFTLSTNDWELKGHYSCVANFCPMCGDGVCSGESCSTCPSDCGVCTVCGNGICEGGESCQTSGGFGQCKDDCGCCEGWVPAPSGCVSEDGEIDF